MCYALQFVMYGEVRLAPSPNLPPWPERHSGEELNFRKLTGTTRAFPNIKKILGKVDSGRARCGSRFNGGAGLRTVVARRNH